MPRIVTQGRPRHVLRSWACLMAISARVVLRRLIGQRLVPGWPVDLEIGTLFWRGQFTHALTRPDPAEGRAYFDALQTLTDEVYAVTRTQAVTPIGDWITPTKHGDEVLYYLHGGGYMFSGSVSQRFGDMLAHHLNVRTFALTYRLTPDHPHPAQIDDAVRGYRHLLDQGIDPARIIVLGDSAGGHLTLMLLCALRAAGLPQPALAVGLCPWTDIGARGRSLQANDRYDLVQGWMALQFGRMLQGNTTATRQELSPIDQDFAGLSPIYLQGGGREVLIDMIREFAAHLRQQSCPVTLDVWPDMTHDFQAHGLTRPESRAALIRLRQAMDWRLEGRSWNDFPPIAVTDAPAKPE